MCALAVGQSVCYVLLTASFRLKRLVKNQRYARRLGKNYQGRVYFIYFHIQDSDLMETVKTILKDADLQKATTKSVCMQVYAKYPGIDLSKRRNYIVSCIEIVTASL